MVQIREPKVIDILHFLTHGSLSTYKKIGSNAPLTKRMQHQKLVKTSNKKGVVFVSPSKTFLEEGKGHIVTSYETLNEQYNKLSHWTPNTFRGGTYYDFKNRIIKGHTKDNLKQINVIGFDIDTKNVDLYSIFTGCDELELPRPNLLLETPKGYQGFFVLETPFYINRKHDYKALRVAERLAANILDALKQYVPVDTNCNAFGFFRIPQDGNIILFDDKPANTKLLLAWSEQYEKQYKKPSLVVYSNDASASKITATAWYESLLRATNINSGYYASSRNNAVFTLAIANYSSGVSYEDAYNVLDEFNSSLVNPLNDREIKRTLNSAYSGRYKGPKRNYVEGLLELWTDGQVSFKGKTGWYKFKKDRKERERSHYQEWEQDILMYLEEHTTAKNPFLEGSLSMLAKQFGMALSSLKEVLKRSGKLIKRTIGRGRYARTMLASRSMLFKHLLYKRKQYVEYIQCSFAELLPEHNQILTAFDIPDLEELFSVYFKNTFGHTPPLRWTG